MYFLDLKGLSLQDSSNPSNVLIFYSRLRHRPPRRHARNHLAVFRAVLAMIPTLLVFFMASFCTTAVKAQNAPSQPQELERLLKAALAFNPGLHAAEEHSLAAKQKYRAETMFTQNPVLSVSYQNIPLPDFPALDAHAMSSLTFSASQMLNLPHETFYRRETAEMEYRIRDEAVQDSSLRLIYTVSQLYYEYIFQVETKRILEENRSTLGNIVSVARSLVAVNKMHSSQLLKLEADLSILTNRIYRTEAQMQKTIEAIYQMTGTRPVEPKPGKKSASVESLSIPDGFDWKEHPAYRQGKAAVQREEAALSHEKAALFPAITVAATYSIRAEIPGKDAGDDFIGFRVSAPLPAYYPIRENRLIAAKEASLNAARHRLDEIELSLRQGFQGEKELAERLLLAYLNFEGDALPRYLASYRAQMSSFSAGTVGLLDVLDSYRLYLNVEIETAQTRRDLLTSLARLDYYAGRRLPLEESAQIPPATNRPAPADRQNNSQRTNHENK